MINIADRAGGREREGERVLRRLEILYQRYVGPVFTLCLRLLSDLRAAEDATVHVFALFGRELSRRMDESGIPARLRELAIDEALGRLKPFGDRSESQSTVASMSGNRSELPRTLDSASLDTLTAKLPDRLRVAFVLYDREGLSFRAVAYHLRVDEAEARHLVHRARLHVRQLWLSRSSEQES